MTGSSNPTKEFAVYRAPSSNSNPWKPLALRPTFQLAVTDGRSCTRARHILLPVRPCPLRVRVVDELEQMGRYVDLA